MKENFDRSSETIPASEIAAEATNEGAPAQSIPETVPPRARAGKSSEEPAVPKSTRRKIEPNSSRAE
jgi:hypothetical protein